jgi:Tol biopolymer transport system component
VPNEPADTAGIVFYGNTEPGSSELDNEIYVVDPTSGEVSAPLTRNKVHDTFATWSPDRSRIAFARDVGGQRDLFAMNADGSGQAPLVAGPSDDWFPAYSKDGDIAFIRNRSQAASELWLLPEGGQPRVVPGLPEDRIIRSPAWAPDGSMILFWGNVEDRSNIDVYSIRADGTGLERLTTDPRVDRNPTMSPDGKTVAFVSDRDRTSPPDVEPDPADLEIYLLDVPSRSISRRVTDNPVQDGNPVWSPSGRALAFYRSSDTGFHIWIVDLETGQERDLMEGRAGRNLDPNWR